ncbi:MAG: hypothetical protein LC790_15000 [Actinobacteria bacterium]|nr:hypothetical protein [Actinomycetota bacterium]
MPPERAAFAPQRILAVLARHEVRCVVIGGYAAVLAGVDFVTRDIDITPALDAANLQRLAAALQELHAAIRVPNEPPVALPSDARLLARAEIWNLATDAGDLDITTRPAGTDGYVDLLRGAYSQSLAGGLQIAIASLQDIIRSKTAAGRAKDLAALPQLRAALERHRASASSDQPTGGPESG